MGRGWIAMHRGEESDMLQEHYPDAFLLLCQIARRARVVECKITKIQKGEALIGDFKKAGLLSERKYRTAKKKLLELGLSTFRSTSKATAGLSPQRQASDRQVTGKRRLRRMKERKRLRMKKKKRRTKRKK
jgi:hypothetical protein